MSKMLHHSGIFSNCVFFRFHISNQVTATGDKISYLNISDAQTNDGGLYQCEAVSKVGIASHSARLNVHGLPHVRPMEKKMIVAGGTLFVTCPYAGYPIESVTWERGTISLFRSKQFETTITKIKKVSLIHFCCRFTNFTY